MQCSHGCHVKQDSAGVEYVQEPCTCRGRFKRTNQNGKRDTWYIHDRLVSILNASPIWYGVRVSLSKNELLHHLKPVFHEMIHTQQLTKQEILKILFENGYRISEKTFDLMMKRSSWESAQDVAGYRAKRKDKKYTSIDKTKMDALIMQCGRELPPHKIDPRILLRYWELARVIPEKSITNFFMVTDMLNQIERRAREKWEDGSGIEYENFIPDMKTGDEIKRWIRSVD